MIKSIGFPKIFNTNTTIIKEDYEATKQNIISLLWSEKGELLGDPFYGMRIKRYLFDQNDAILKDILIDDIRTQLTAFMPQITVDRKDITIEQKGKKLYCSIKAKNNITFRTDMYNLVLFNAEDK